MGRMKMGNPSASAEAAAHRESVANGAAPTPDEVRAEIARGREISRIASQVMRTPVSQLDAPTIVASIEQSSTTLAEADPVNGLISPHDIARRVLTRIRSAYHARDGHAEWFDKDVLGTLPAEEMAPATA